MFMFSCKFVSGLVRLEVFKMLRKILWLAGLIWQADVKKVFLQLPSPFSLPGQMPEKWEVKMF